MVALFTCVVLIAAGFLVLSIARFRRSPVSGCVCLRDNVLLCGLAKVNPLRAKLCQRLAWPLNPELQHTAACRCSHIWLHMDLRLNVYALIRTLELVLGRKEDIWKVKLPFDPTTNKK